MPMPSVDGGFKRIILKPQEVIEGKYLLGLESVCWLISIFSSVLIFVLPQFETVKMIQTLFYLFPKTVQINLH